MIVINTNFGDIELLKQILNDEYPSLHRKVIFADTDKQIKQKIKNASVFLTFNVSQEVIDNAELLKLIQIPVVGVNQISNKLNIKKIPICNVHGNSAATAEHAIALMFAVAKEIVVNHRDLTRGIWHNLLTDKRKTIHIGGKSAGIIGFGGIGKQIAKLCRCMGMNVNVLKRTPKIERQYMNIINKLFAADELDRLIEISDFIFVAVPLTHRTRGMIDKNKLDKMKNKILINIARGPIVDEKALYYALKDGHLKGAGIDVWYNYPSSEDQACLPSKFPFHMLSNVVISPHCGGLTYEGMRDCYREALENIINLYAGKPLVNQINIEKRY